jgi:hypothetical protein
MQREPGNGGSLQRHCEIAFEEVEQFFQLSGKAARRFPSPETNFPIHAAELCLVYAVAENSNLWVGECGAAILAGPIQPPCRRSPN